MLDFSKCLLFCITLFYQKRKKLNFLKTQNILHMMHCFSQIELLGNIYIMQFLFQIQNNYEKQNTMNIFVISCI